MRNVILRKYFDLLPKVQQDLAMRRGTSLQEKATEHMEGMCVRVTFNLSVSNTIFTRNLTFFPVEYLYTQVLPFASKDFVHFLDSLILYIIIIFH